MSLSWWFNQRHIYLNEVRKFTDSPGRLKNQVLSRDRWKGHALLSQKLGHEEGPPNRPTTATTLQGRDFSFCISAGPYLLPAAPWSLDGSLVKGMSHPPCCYYVIARDKYSCLVKSDFCFWSISKWDNAFYLVWGMTGNIIYVQFQGRVLQLGMQFRCQTAPQLSLTPIRKQNFQHLSLSCWFRKPLFQEGRRNSLGLSEDFSS